jgi:hypothetical protein
MLAAPVDATEAVSRFKQAWNEPDTAQRLLLLRSCCAPDAEFASPQGVIRCLEPFNASIDAFLRAFPHAAVLFGQPDAHNGYVRVRWRTRFNDGAHDPIFGDDFMQFDPAGLLIRVISFDGSPAEA